MSAICSSQRRPRSRKFSPSASNSTSFQPTPMPSVMRPPLSTSTSAACLATSAVWRWGRIRMPVTNRMRSVTAARCPKSTKGSWNMSSIWYQPDQPGRTEVSAPSTWS